MQLIFKSFKDDLQQGIEGANFVLQSKLSHSFARRRAKDSCLYNIFRLGISRSVAEFRSSRVWQSENLEVELLR